MNEDPNALLEQAIAVLEAQEKQLSEELTKVRSVLAATRKALGGGSGRKQAPHGSLKSAIMDVLDRTHAKSNSDIRAALAKSGYPHSLTPGHVTKTLMALTQAKKVVRTGTGTNSQYVKNKA
jgi:hypothetical protein